MSTELAQAFATPLWHSKYPEFDKHEARFVDCLRAIRASNEEGVVVSNVNGYQTPGDLTRCTELEPLFNHITLEVVRQAVGDMRFKPCRGLVTSAWANFNDTARAVNDIHSHGDTFAGVFYLKAPPGSGDLVLYNQSYNPLWEGNQLIESTNEYSSKTRGITPVAGDIFLWCSPLPHYVLPNERDEERISIAFNVKCFL